MDKMIRIMVLRTHNKEQNEEERGKETRKREGGIGIKGGNCAR